jgi:hypothetical protein
VILIPLLRMNNPNKHLSGGKSELGVVSTVGNVPALVRAGKAGRVSLNAAFGFVLAAGLLLSACGRKESNAQAPPAGANAGPAQTAVSPGANPVNPEASPDAQEKARVAQALAMRQGRVPAAPSITLRGGELATPDVLAAYNQQLAQLIFKQRDAPESLEELVRKWPMPRLPTPPPGKQIVYDARNRIIKLDPP